MAVRTRAQLKSDAASLLPDNTAGEISPADVRGRVVDLADSAKLAEDLGTAAALNAGTAAGNVPVLDGAGKLVESVIPAIAITDTFVVASQVAMLALNVQRGDIAVRTDLNKSFVLQAAPASTLANWVELRTPTDTVLSVNGKTGAVTLAKGDVGLGNVDNTSDANKPVSTAQSSAINGRAAADLSNVTQANARAKVGTGTMAYRNFSFGAGDPSGGADGDIYFKVS